MPHTQNEHTHNTNTHLSHATRGELDAVLMLVGLRQLRCLFLTHLHEVRKRRNPQTLR